MSTFRELLSRAQTKQVTFMGEKVSIKKMTVKDVQEIRAMVDEINKSPADTREDANLDMMIHVIKLAVVGAGELERDEFLGFPLQELGRLCDEALVWSGLGKAPEAAKG